MFGNTIENEHVTAEEIERVRRMLHVGIGAWWGRQRSRPPVVSYEDLIQEADIRLLKAAQDFRADMRCSFSTYGYKCGFGAAQHYYRDNHHIPRREFALAPKLYRENGGENPEDSPFNSMAALAMVSLDDPLGPEYGAERQVDQLEDRRDQFSWVLVSDVLRKLPEQIADAVKLYYLDGYSQVEIGKRYGVSQMEISRRLATGKRLIAQHWGLRQ
jgi:RNA polymerase sigma factor (sigma-70 family)